MSVVDSSSTKPAPAPSRCFMSLLTNDECFSVGSGPRIVPSTTTRIGSDGFARQICTFFAMGGCSRGERCQFSHELTQTAPAGVDATGGFFISGNVANYRPVAGAASPPLHASLSSPASSVTGPSSPSSLNPQAKSFSVTHAAAAVAAPPLLQPQPQVTVRVEPTAGKAIRVSGGDMVATLAKVAALAELGPATTSATTQESGSIMQLSSSGSGRSSPLRTNSNVSSAFGCRDARAAVPQPVVETTAAVSHVGAAPYQPRYTHSQCSFQSTPATLSPSTPIRSIVVGRQPEQQQLQTLRNPQQPLAQQPQPQRTSAAHLVPAPRSAFAFAGQQPPRSPAAVAANGAVFTSATSAPRVPRNQHPLQQHQQNQPQPLFEGCPTVTVGAAGMVPAPAATLYPTVQVGERPRTNAVGPAASFPSPTQVNGICSGVGTNTAFSPAPAVTSAPQGPMIRLGKQPQSQLHLRVQPQRRQQMREQQLNLQQQQQQQQQQPRLYVAPQRYEETRPQLHQQPQPHQQAISLQPMQVQVQQPFRIQQRPQTFVLAPTSTPGQFALVPVSATVDGCVSSVMTGGGASSIYMLEGNTLRCLPPVSFVQ